MLMIVIVLSQIIFNSYSKCHYAECPLCWAFQNMSIMLSVIMLIVIMPSAVFYWMSLFWA